MKRVATFADARLLREGRVGLVPTMGFLHEGHLALVERARAECDTVLMSVFVNPAQFSDDADLAAYPRDVERDAALAASAGVDV
ncbi:MAG: pantoate--beta-alanine ligase, partial [Proteobacteria bacterium]|nr:pantoate--beta-alanine ligase [Pseudomonadota bacterium]